MRIKWTGFADTPNVQADERHRRYFKAETFENAIAKVVEQGDFLIAPAVAAILPDAEIVSLSFELEDEFAHALVFHGVAVVKGRKSAEFRLLVAKDPEDRSLALRRTLKALTHAYERDPGRALRPLTSGNIFLPDRHRRVEKGRDIFCMVTALIPDAHPLCVARGGRLAERLHAPKLLSIDEELNIRSQLIELAARLYNPRSQTGILLPNLAGRQVEVVRKGRATRPVLAMPDGLRTRLTVPRFIHELVSWEAVEGGNALRVRPPELDDFRDALIAAVGEENADDWLARYKRSVVQRKLPAIPPLMPADLTAIGIE
jgi:hypothetical protein